jgi:hypothetical protein
MGEYRAAAEEYSRTVNMLRSHAGVLSKTEYDNILDFIEKARERTEAARVALDRHISEHGC